MLSSWALSIWVLAWKDFESRRAKVHLYVTFQGCAVLSSCSSVILITALNLIFCGFYFFVFLIISLNTGSTNITLDLNAKVNRKQKNVHLRGDQLIDRQPLCCQNTFYKQFISVYTSRSNNPKVSGNT